MTISTLALTVLPALCCPQGAPQTHEPPPYEAVFGSAIVRENVGKNLKLNTDTTTRWQNEFSFAINPANPQNFLGSSNDYRSGSVALGRHASIDGGKSVAADGTLPLAGWPEAGDPAVGYDGAGNGYIMGLHFRRSPSLRGAVYVHKTTDGGRTFQAPVLAYNGNDLPDKPLLTVDQRTSGTFAGSLYITFTPFFSSLSGLQSIHSRDGGRTWSRPVRIGSGQGTSPAIGPNGEVYVAWQSGNSIQFNSSVDGGVSYRGVRTVASITRNPSPLRPTSFRCNSFPSTAVDRSGGPFNGRIHVTWSSRSGTSSEIFASFSDNGGASWSTPRRVNDVTTGDQFFQWMAVDEAGTAFVCWQDRRNDPQNRSYEGYASASFDGGQTWVTNWKASESQNDPGSSGFIGDYNALDARRGRGFATWVDFRNGNQDYYTAAVQSDLEFSPTTLSAATGGSVDLPIKAGPARSGQNYLLVASLAGTSTNGLPIGNATFFLNVDPLVAATAANPNTGPFQNTAGVLGAGGIPASQPKFVVPGGLLGSLAGSDISFAYVLLDSRANLLSYGSNPASLRITN